MLKTRGFPVQLFYTTYYFINVVLHPADHIQLHLDLCPLPNETMSTGIGAGGTGGGGPAHSPFRSGAGFGTYQSNDRHSNNSTGQRQSYGGDGSPGEFTAAMRDRQARGKDPYNRRESWGNRTVPRTSSGYDWGAPLEDV